MDLCQVLRLGLLAGNWFIALLVLQLWHAAYSGPSAPGCLLFHNAGVEQDNLPGGHSLFHPFRGANGWPALLFRFWLFHQFGPAHGCGYAKGPVCGFAGVHNAFSCSWCQGERRSPQQAFDFYRNCPDCPSRAVGLLLGHAGNLSQIWPARTANGLGHPHHSWGVRKCPASNGCTG